MNLSHNDTIAQGDALTLQELTMLHLMESITDKADWHLKVFNKQLVQSWRREACDPEDMDDTDKMLDYCFAELQSKALWFQKSEMILSSDCGATVIKLDNVIHPERKRALGEACAPLENIPDKDWHPGSDQMVVHPWLFPLIYGRSNALPSGKVGLKDCANYIGKGQLVEKPDENADWDKSPGKK